MDNRAHWPIIDHPIDPPPGHEQDYHASCTCGWVAGSLRFASDTALCDWEDHILAENTWHKKEV